MKMSDKPVGIVVASWNPNEPRFIVKESNEGIADERGFKNGKCVFNQRLGFAYSVDEIVEVLNNYEELEKKHKELKQDLEDNKII